MAVLEGGEDVIGSVQIRAGVRSVEALVAPRALERVPAVIIPAPDNRNSVQFVTKGEMRCE